MTRKWNTRTSVKDTSLTPWRTFCKPERSRSFCSVFLLDSPISTFQTDFLGLCLRMLGGGGCTCTILLSLSTSLYYKNSKKLNIKEFGQVPKNLSGTCHFKGPAIWPIRNHLKLGSNTPGSRTQGVHVSGNTREILIFQKDEIVFFWISFCNFYCFQSIVPSALSQVLRQRAQNSENSKNCQKISRKIQSHLFEKSIFLLYFR